jgi:DNA-binding MarR family transcriptional regulator
MHQQSCVTKKIQRSIGFSGRVGGQFDIPTSTLVISSSSNHYEGLILRECFISSMQGKNCPEAILDVATEFAHQELTPSQRRNWTKMTEGKEERRIRANLVYAPIADVRRICRIGGADQLDRIVRELQSRTRYGIEFTFEEYAEFLAKKVQTHIVKLSKTEVKVLDTLLRYPEITIPELEQKLGFSRSWTSSLVSNLKAKEVVFLHEKVPFSRIGIQMFHLLISDDDQSKPFELFSNCPFLFEIRHVIAGRWNELATLTVPSNLKSIDALNRFRKILHSYDIETELFEVAASALSYSFNFYSTILNAWDIPWMTLQGWGSRIEREGLQNAYERLDKPAITTDVHLDGNDMKIMASVHNVRTKARDLRKELAIGQNKLFSHLKKLRTNGLIVQWWNVYNIGLVEWIAIQAPAKHAQMIDVWARELPRVFIRYDKKRNLFMLVNLPKGDSVELMKTLVALEWNRFLTILPLDLGIWGHWGFPFHLWNVERQTWQAPVKEIEQWMISLEK